MTENQMVMMLSALWVLSFGIQCFAPAVADWWRRRKGGAS